MDFVLDMGLGRRVAHDLPGRDLGQAGHQVLSAPHHVDMLLGCEGRHVGIGVHVGKYQYWNDVDLEPDYVLHRPAHGHGPVPGPKHRRRLLLQAAVGQPEEPVVVADDVRASLDLQGIPAHVADPDGRVYLLGAVAGGPLVDRGALVVRCGQLVQDGHFCAASGVVASFVRQHAGMNGDAHENVLLDS